MTIVEAVLAVMRSADKPMSASEVAEAMIARGLYAFKASQPAQIVLQQIRRHCVGVDNRQSSKAKLFARSGDTKYVALPSPNQRE
jgi:hypothetical protein